MGLNKKNKLRIVWARSWWSKDEPVKLYTEPTVLQPFIRVGLTFAIAQYLGLVHGAEPADLPQVTDGLMEATDLFQGLMRPLDEADADDNRYVYVTSPPCSYTYENLKDLSGTQLPIPCAKPRSGGRDAAFVTYVKPLEAPQSFGSEADVRGLVCGWEWVPADEAGRPQGWQQRYSRKVW